jgi:YidC/Oxa1 family membrane protein insertase
LLVLLVRTLLHPLTKKSQVSMMKMGKLGPKVEELKKKYASNPSEMNKRVMELYREQGANPMLGFLPMMVQMPIWISLYAAINASIDLRGAAFLPFWITDLSAPDMLFSFPTITIPLLGWHISSFNLLPILLAVGMVMQQKLMSSSQTASASPQMAQQQKMMMIMMPIMMLIFLYTAPSGLNLYIMASTFGGVIEQKIIKKHIKEQEDKEKYGKVPVTAKTGGKLKKKKPKPMYKIK